MAGYYWLLLLEQKSNLKVRLDTFFFFAGAENWKYCSKIIFKYVNSVMWPVNSALCPLHSVHMWCYCSQTVPLSPAQYSHVMLLFTCWKKKKKREEKMQTWVWKCGSKPTLSVMFKFELIITNHLWFIVKMLWT